MIVVTWPRNPNLFVTRHLSHDARLISCARSDACTAHVHAHAGQTDTHTIASSATVISRPSCALARTRTHAARDTDAYAMRYACGATCCCVAMYVRAHAHTHAYVHVRAFARRITQRCAIASVQCTRELKTQRVPTTRGSRLPQPLDGLSCHHHS